MDSGSPRAPPQMKFGPRGLCRTVCCHPRKAFSFSMFILAVYSTFILNLEDTEPPNEGIEDILGPHDEKLPPSDVIEPDDPYFVVDDPKEVQNETVFLLRRGNETALDLNRLVRETMRVLQDAFLQEGPSKKIYHNLLDVKRPPYLPNYKAPCWIESLNISTPYNKSQFNRLDSYKPTLRYMEAVFRERMSRGEKWRLRCLPYFYIAGLAKCGTSELYTRLHQHPNITHGAMKEPHYWTRYRMGWMPPGYVPIRDYADMYDHAAQEIQERMLRLPNGTTYHPMFFGDGSVSTFLENDYFRNVAENSQHEGIPLFFTAHYIRHITPMARIIVLFRNPTDRLYSDYLFFSVLKKNQHTPPSPENFHRRVQDAIDIMKDCIKERGSDEKCVYDLKLREEMMHLNLRTGMYSIYLRRWLDIWPRDQILFLRVEDLNKEGRINVLNKVLRFLGENNLPQNTVKELENAELRNTRPQDLRKVGPMLNITRQVLDEFYGPYNQQLAELLHDQRYLWH